MSSVDYKIIQEICQEAGHSIRERISMQVEDQVWWGVEFEIGFELDSTVAAEVEQELYE